MILSADVLVGRFNLIVPKVQQIDENGAGFSEERFQRRHNLPALTVLAS